KAFASGGRIVMDLDGGEYTVRPAADDRIRVTLTGNAGESTVEVSADGARADVKVRDTPRNFKATIEVPKTADLSLHFKGGDLTVAPIAGNKELESYGGDVKIGVGNRDDYARVDCSGKAGRVHGLRRPRQGEHRRAHDGAGARHPRCAASRRKRHRALRRRPPRARRSLAAIPAGQDLQRSPARLRSSQPLRRRRGVDSRAHA